MAVVVDKPIVAAQRPRPTHSPDAQRPCGPGAGLAIAPRVRGIPWAPESLDVGVRTWTRELLQCRHLLALSAAFLVVALFADYQCGVYVTARPGVKVPDLILDLLPTIDLSFLFTYGYMALIVGMFLYPLWCRPRMLHVVAIQFSLLLILRSVFMIFMHVSTPADSVAVQFPGFFSRFYFENDMFFSGHTAMPFLGFYLFRPHRLRYVYLGGSIVMGIVALLMHVHYSIDVFGAFFMTYCSYQMGSALLGKLDPLYQR
jgi:hypothetical protein